MSKYIKLLLFFLCLLFQISILHDDVIAKEIKYEMRGVFLTLDDFDFDSMLDVNNFKNYITRSYDNFKDSGFNTVFVDISKFIDLSITNRFNETYENALKVIVKEAFNRSLEIHGSFSNFALNIRGENLEEYLTSLDEKSFIKDKIDWIVKFNDEYYLDPGVHEVRDYYVDLIVNLSNKYNFDGVYLDGIIYPHNINKYTFNDSFSFNTYNKDNLSKDNWRRQNVNDFMKVLGDKFKSYKHELKFGVGANYIWRSLKDDLNGIDYEGYADYDKGAFDSLNIGKMGYINYMVVKIPDDITLDSDIKNIISWWEKKFRTHLVDIFIEGDNNILDIIKSTRDNYFVNGFLYKGFSDSDDIRSILNSKAIVPRFKSFDSYYTLCDLDITSKLLGNKIEFNILDEGYENTKNFVVYKFPYDDIDFSNGDYIEDIIPSKGKITKLSLNKENGVYAITKINYNSIENRILSSFVVNDEFGVIEEKFLVDKPKVVNDRIEFCANSSNKNNEFKFVVEKDGEHILEKDFSKDSNYSFILEDKGIYKINMIVTNIKDRENILETYLNFEVKDKYVVVLDAGHGGEESGAKSQEEIMEKDINLSICNYIKDLLKDIDKITVKNTRVNDIKIDLSDRVKLCSFLGGDVFLSIHQNAFDNINANGIETYYYSKENLSKELSDLIQKNLILNTKAFDRGVKTSNFVVLRENIIPSTLIECGFITNREEGLNLSDDEYQKIVSESIFKSIMTFFDVEYI